MLQKMGISASDPRFRTQIWIFTSSAVRKSGTTAITIHRLSSLCGVGMYYVGDGLEDREGKTLAGVKLETSRRMKAHRAELWNEPPG